MARDNTKRHTKPKSDKVADKTKTERINQFVQSELSKLPIASWTYPRPLLCVLKERSMSYMDSVFDNFWLIAAQGCQPLMHNYSRTDISRNKSAAAFLDTDFTHLIMLDIDHKHPVDIIQRLSWWFLRDKLDDNPKNIQIVGGLNFRRSAPYDPCCHLFGKDGNVYAPAEWKPGSLLKVNNLGTGSIMIAREVFEKIPPPWFYNIYEQDRIWCDVWPGEDIGFSERCRQFGIDMYVDTGLTSPHVGEWMIDERAFRASIDKSKLTVVKKDFEFIDE